MADTAHRLTDEKLEEMEKRLSAIYFRAKKEIQQTADEYFSKFSKQDEAKRKLMQPNKNFQKHLLFGVRSNPVYNITYFVQTFAEFSRVSQKNLRRFPYSFKKELMQAFLLC